MVATSCGGVAVEKQAKGPSSPRRPPPCRPPAGVAQTPELAPQQRATPQREQHEVPHVGVEHHLRLERCGHAYWCRRVGGHAPPAERRRLRAEGQRGRRARVGRGWCGAARACIDSPAAQWAHLRAQSAEEPRLCPLAARLRQQQLRTKHTSTGLRVRAGPTGAGEAGAAREARAAAATGWQERLTLCSWSWRPQPLASKSERSVVRPDSASSCTQSAHVSAPRAASGTSFSAGRSNPWLPSTPAPMSQKAEGVVALGAPATTWQSSSSTSRLYVAAARAPSPSILSFLRRSARAPLVSATVQRCLPARSISCSSFARKGGSYRPNSARTDEMRPAFAARESEREKALEEGKVCLRGEEEAADGLGALDATVDEAG
eukprot:scaffold66038_cov27-Tisochrysis_lutea.AAC.2